MYACVCLCVCVCGQSCDEGLKSADIRRLSSPIVNPNFEEDFNAALTTALNTDEVLASLSCVSMALTSSADDDVIVALTSSADDDDDESDVDGGQTINHDDSVDLATSTNHAPREEVRLLTAN